MPLKNVLNNMSEVGRAMNTSYADFQSEFYVDGQAIYDINIRMDWDIHHISYGDTNETIGQVFFTDFVIANNSLVISAH